jgi:hypothetical protein
VDDAACASGTAVTPGGVWPVVAGLVDDSVLLVGVGGCEGLRSQPASANAMAAADSAAATGRSRTGW